jgi:hypothetical protein
LLKKELDIEVETVGGKTGELTVWVGDQLVARKGRIRFPGDQTVLQAVKAALKS